MTVRFPRPLRPGDRIGVTAPSSGVEGKFRPRFEVAVQSLRNRGYDVVLGECLGASSIVSAPKEARAAELVAMLTDPTIAAVVPPWGGEMAIDLLDVLDWDALAAAEPTWLVGFSDLCTIMLPLTTRLGWATLHGSNLMDTPYAAPDGFVHWTDVASATGPVTQTSPGRYRTAVAANYVANPGIDTIELDAAGPWSLLDGGEAMFSGRLVGGCIEVLSPLKGTPFADVASYGREHAEDGLVVFLEACENNAFDIARALHGFRLAGWFEQANGVLIGRTSATDSDGMTQREAVADALGGLDLPVVLDVECGHVAPYLPLVNGAVADIDTGRGEITQSLA